MVTTMVMRFIRILSTHVDRLGPLGPEIAQAVVATRATADDQEHCEKDKYARDDDEQPEEQG